MTREEQIIQASEIFSTNDLLSFGGACEELDYGFREGAKWADKNPINVWHDASEEPEGTNWKILCQDENDGCWVENRIDAQLLHKDWNAYTEIEMVVRWAYIKDLLPKRGKK